MAKELMEIGGFITEGAEIVNHDNTLSGNGTVDSPLGVVPGYNETLLWSGNYSGTRTKQFDLSESYKNFDQLEIWWGNQVGSTKRGVVITRYPNDDYQNAWQGVNACSDSDAHLAYKMCFLSANSNTQFTAYNYRQAMINTTATGNFVWGKDKEYYECYPVKIVGINRKA
jgi:hypothetical protein